MTQLIPYLLFNGNCREAMTFYRESLGGNLELQEVGDTPMGDSASDEGKKKIMHAVLTSGELTLFASDMLDSDAVKPNETTNLCLNFTSEEETKSAFAKLSTGAEVGHELKEEFWGATYGDLVDKYGFRWMFNYTKNQK